MEVVVVRSPRRRRTVQARIVGGKLQVSIPATMTKADEDHWVAEMLRRMSRRQAADSVDLSRRAAGLADRYGFPKPASIRWVDNQRSRWGSCTPSDGSVRISSRLAAFPTWVLDYVIVHELAHLLEPGHGPRFQRLVGRYPRAERAIGFLIAKGLDVDEAPGERAGHAAAESPVGDGAGGAAADRSGPASDRSGRAAADAAGTAPRRATAGEPGGPPPRGRPDVSVSGRRAGEEPAGDPQGPLRLPGV